MKLSCRFSSGLSTVQSLFLVSDEPHVINVDRIHRDGPETARTTRGHTVRYKDFIVCAAAGDGGRRVGAGQ